MHNVDFHYKNLLHTLGRNCARSAENRQLRHTFMPLKSLDELLKSSKDKGLAEVIDHARDMGDLVQLLQDALPSEQRPAIAAANIRDDGELVVLASSSAWAARMRYETDVLMAAVKAVGHQVNKVSVRVTRG
jgi:hypothetical protein